MSAEGNRLERRPLPHLHPDTAKLWTDAYYDGAVDRFAEAAETSPRLADRFNTLNLYFNLPNATLEDTSILIRPRKPFSRQRAHQLLKEGIDLLSRFGSDDFKSKYINQRFTLGKDVGVASKVRLSLSKGGRTVRAAQMALGGAPADEIRDTVANTQFGQIRQRLQNWGIPTEEPTPRSTTPEQMKERIDALSTPTIPQDTFEEILTGLTSAECRYLKTKGVLLSLLDVSGIAGLHCTPRDFDLLRQVLLKGGVHLKTTTETLLSEKNKNVVQKHHFLALRELNLAVNALTSDQSVDKLRTNPVRQVAGPESPNTPTTTQMVRGINYIGVRAILHSEGLNVNLRAGETVDSLLSASNCPISVYTYNGATRIDREDIPAFRGFARRLKLELGR